jgi:PII-like signaling protein
VTIVIVDTADHIDAFLPQLDDLISEGLVVREDINIVAYRGRSD